MKFDALSIEVNGEEEASFTRFYNVRTKVGNRTTSSRTSQRMTHKKTIIKVKADLFKVG